MDFYSLSDKAVEQELGSRIRALRLRRNITQQQLAEATVLSLNTIKALESGRGKLASLIAVLRELGGLDNLDSFIPKISISPLQLAKRQGRVRERASAYRGTDRTKTDAKDVSEW